MNIKISTNNFNIPKINFKGDDNKKNMTAPKESKLEKTPQNDTFEMFQMAIEELNNYIRCDDSGYLEKLEELIYDFNQ